MLTLQFRFVKGHTLLVGLVSMSFVLTSFMTFYFRRENARRDKVLEGMGVTLDEYSNHLKLEEKDKGDDAVFFRYTV
jgi:hypothetical protein